MLIRPEGPDGTAVTDMTQQLGLRERKKQRTRQLIADTAMRLFLERGFDAVTIAEVARAAEVDAKTVYNYFPSKPRLVYYSLETFEAALLDAVRQRKPGESILAAFARFVINSHGLLADEGASQQLKALGEMIVSSPALLAHEQQVFARVTASLAALIADETRTHPDDAQPWAVAHALMGFHRTLIDFVRRRTLAGTPNRQVVREFRAQARHALTPLEGGLARFGSKAS
jgi:AcrR family transcriptional regulator